MFLEYAGAFVHAETFGLGGVLEISPVRSAVL
jgi:hypothetical protein